MKDYDRGKFSVHDGEQAETSLAALHRHLEQALELNSIEMALANVSPDAMHAEVTPHLESLAFWFESERNTLWNIPTTSADTQEEENAFYSGNKVRAETFLLAPEIGLRGRLDLFWQQSGQQRLLELKTGGASGQLPKRDHRWQVLGYHALLTVRRNSQMKRALATLLYSGTPGSAQAFGIPATIREIQRVNETRNILVLSRVTGIPSTPPGASRCGKCAMLERCQHVSALLKWQPPEPDPQMLAKRSHPSAKSLDMLDTVPLGSSTSGGVRAASSFPFDPSVDTAIEDHEFSPDIMRSYGWKNVPASNNKPFFGNFPSPSASNAVLPSPT